MQVWTGFGGEKRKVYPMVAEDCVDVVAYIGNNQGWASLEYSDLHMSIATEGCQETMR